MSTPIRTSAADPNYLSVSKGNWGLNEGSTDPTLPEQNLPGQPSPLSLTPSNAQSYSAILKICDGTSNLTLPAWGTGYVDIAQGKENALDLNNGSTSITVAARFGAGGGSGDQVVTIKGGCKGVTLKGSICSTGNEADVVLDAWSDQSSALVSGIDLSGLSRADGHPVTIILGRFGSKVDHYPPSYQVLFWKSLGYKAYWLAKWAAVKLGLVKGVKS